MKEGLTKEHSRMLYGLAIVFMLYHHLFCFPSRLNCEYFAVPDILGEGIQQLIAWFCRICVAIYAFISGYAIYKKCHNSEDENYNVFKALLKYYKTIIFQLLNFMKKYWIVFAVFIPIGFIIGKYNSFYWTDLVGFSCKYNHEWWYVRQYIVMLLLVPFLCCLGDLLKYGNKIHWAVSAVILAIVSLVVSIGVQYVTNLVGHGYMVYRIYSFIFCLGYIIAFSGAYEKVATGFEKHQIVELVLSIICVICCYIVKTVLSDTAIRNLIDVVLIVPFIYCACVIFDKCKWLSEPLSFLGKYSVYMWLVHTFYCYYYFRELITISKISMVMFIELFVLSLLTAMLLTLAERVVNLIITKIKELKMWDRLKVRNE